MTETQTASAQPQLAGAIMSAVALWIGASLTREAAIDALLTALEHPDSSAAVNAHTWLLLAADPMPPAMLTGMLLRCLSEAPSLGVLS